jgi:hypothetical protein
MQAVVGLENTARLVLAVVKIVFFTTLSRLFFAGSTGLTNS